MLLSGNRPGRKPREKLMSMNSINTNMSAMVALQSLNRTSDELAAVQKRVSTGLRVSDAKDDGAAFAVAERIRGDMAATTSANQQLGGMKGLLAVTSAALQNLNRYQSIGFDYKWTREQCVSAQRNQQEGFHGRPNHRTACRKCVGR